MRRPVRPLEVDMHRAPRTTPARTIALPRPQAALEIDWIVAGLAVALLLAGLAS